MADDNDVAEILGDFYETYIQRRSDRGGVSARLWYWRQTSRLAVTLLPRRLRLKRRTLQRRRVSAANSPNLRTKRENTIMSIAQDARSALREVRRDFRFYAFAALIIGLGIGANTAVFSVMSPLLLRPLPFDDPEELVWVALSEAEGNMSLVTSRTSNLRDFRDMNQSFVGLTGYNAFFEYLSYNLVGEGEPERLVGVDVAQDFLDVLGVSPMLGRNFVYEEGVWEGRPAAILTHGFWTRRFAADPSIVGRSITLNDVPTEVVGVLPASFDFSSTFSPGSRVDFLRPFPISDETDRNGNTLSIIGRLKPGSTVESTQADLDIIVQHLQAADPDRWGLGAVVSGLQEQIGGRFKSAMIFLAAAAGAVMLIACANLSNLLLARGTKRQKEMAIRSVLGGSRKRLVRQLLMESLALSLLGAFVGVGIAYAATNAVAGTTAVRIPMLHSASIDGMVLLFTLGVALAAGLLMGILPALQISQGREATILNDSSRGSSEGKGHAGIREALVVAEVAIACILLVGGGLLLRSFVSVLDVQLGFRPDGLVAWRVDTNRNLVDWSLPDRGIPRGVTFYEQLVANVEALPGVEAVGLSDCLPLGRNRSWGMRVVGQPDDEEHQYNVYPRIVDFRYLETMGIRLVSGRYFTPDDTWETGNVVLISESGARRMFRGQDPLGQFLTLAGGSEIVGVVEDVRHQTLEHTSGIELYIPMTQRPWGTLDLVVRSPLPPEALIGPVSAAIRATDPTMPTGDFRTLNSVVDRAVSPRRFTLLLLGSFAGTALLLAALGIYGVLSYTVSQRIPEIGIRMALGETGAQVLGRVVKRTMTLAVVGIAIGAAGSFLVTRLIESMLFGVEPADTVTFIGMALVLLSAAALAGFLPARRAARTDPMGALRTE
jgi:predicted permease